MGKTTRPVLLLAACAVAVMALGTGCSTTDAVTGKRVRNMYSIEDDIKMGEAVFQDINAAMQKQGVAVNVDRERTEMIREMIQRIAAVSHLPNLPYEFALYQTNIVNAAAAPGGKIVVFSGLYNSNIGLARDEDEVAAVIAHEIAHVTCRHTTESMTRRLPTDLLLLAGSIYAEASEDEELAALFSIGFIAYQGFFLPKYSRNDEAEADAVGLMYMARAGYDPRAAPRLWKRVFEREGSTPSFITWMSSHPSHEDRYRNLEKLLPQAMAVYEQARQNGR